MSRETLVADLLRFPQIKHLNPEVGGERGVNLIGR
jgi:hypothetical protein